MTKISSWVKGWVQYRTDIEYSTYIQGTLQNNTNQVTRVKEVAPKLLENDFIISSHFS